MPRKSARENGGFRRTGWKAKLAKREADEKRIVKNIYIGASNARRWIILKKKLEYRSDVDFVAYLLNLAEPFSGKGKIERKDKDDSDGKHDTIPGGPVNVDGEDNAGSQRKADERSDFNEVEAEVIESGEGKAAEEEGGRNLIEAEGREGEGDNVGEEEDDDDDDEDDDDDDDEEEDDEDDDGSGGEWTAGRPPLRRSLRSLPTNKETKMSVRRSARNVRKEEEEEEEEEEDDAEGDREGEGRRRKRGERSQRRQRRRERKKRRRRKRLKGSGGESTEEDEDESEIESEGELLKREDETLGNEEGALEVAAVPSVPEEQPLVEQVDPSLIEEVPKKGRRGRKKKVVVPETTVTEETPEKVEGDVENIAGVVMAEDPPVSGIVDVPRDADSMAHVEESPHMIEPESDRVSKHHRHHRRKSRKSKDGMDDDGDEEIEGEDEIGENGEVAMGRKKKRRKRGRMRREEECGGEEGEMLGEDQVEENFPRYEVVEGVSEEVEANQQDKPQLPMQSISQEEGVLIEVGERVKLKRRRKRRHSRGEDGEMGENEGLNGDAGSSEDPLSILRKTAKHKKRKHGHGEGHGNRRKHHDVRKVPIDGVLSEPSPSAAPSLHPEESPEGGGSLPDPSSPNTPTSSATPPSSLTMSKGADNKQRVAIRITLCGECDSRHVLDACPLKRPLTIIHDTVVMQNNDGDDAVKNESAKDASLNDADAKCFATEEEEELQDGDDTQDEMCKKKKKENVDENVEEAVISSEGIKDTDERQLQRNGLPESVEDRFPVPNGKYKPGSERVSNIAQDIVKPLEGGNVDLPDIPDIKAVKDVSVPVENKLECQEGMLANGDASMASNSTSHSKPMNPDHDELESANDTLTSQPSPIPIQDPISTADTAVGSTNAANGGKTFAEASLPMALKLETREAGHGPGVIARRPIARFTQFGPLLGRRIREMDIPDDFGMRHIWEVIGSSGRFLLSTEDAATSNWLRFIRPAPTREQRNVAPVTRGDRLYFVTTAPLQIGEELLYWPDESSGSSGLSGTPQPTAQGQNSSSTPSSSSSSSSGAGWAKKKMEKTNCGGCNLRFGHPLYYRLHCSVFHDPNFSLTIRKYHCKVCGAAVLGKENIMRHAAENHDGKGAYQCQFCKKFFLRLNYLEMHRTYGCAANPQRTRPLCDFCGRKFCQPQKLKVHIKRMHSDMADVLREFQCKLCLKLLGSRAALQRHMKEVHHRDVVGACACDRCGKTFQNKSNLKIHMLTHSGVKPFRCREGNCPAAFTTKQCLQFHYKKVHGYNEENMPIIERCVAYTFDAYSGGTVEDPGRGKVPLFTTNRMEKEQEDSSTSNQAPDSEAGEDESASLGARSMSPQRGRKDLADGRRDKIGTKGRGRRPGRPVGRANGPKDGMQPKSVLEGDGLVEAMVPSVIPEEILPPPDTDVLPPPPPVIPSLPEGPECKDAMLGNMADSQPPPLTPQPGPLPTEVAPQTPTLEAYNGGQAALGTTAPSLGSYADHSRIPYPGKVVSKGSKKWMGDGSVPMRPSLEAEMEDEDDEDEDDEDEEEEEDEGVGKRVVDNGVVEDSHVVGDVYGAFPDDSRFVPVAEDGEEGFRRPEESNASLLVEAALDAAERDMTGVTVAEDDSKHQEPDGGGGYLTSPPRTNGPDRHMDDDDHQRILHHPQPSHHAHHHLQHHHHLSLHHQLPPPHHPHHPHVHHHLPPASHLHVQGGALMLHHPHHHHPHHSVMHQEEDEEEERMGPGSEAASVGTIVERIVNTSLAEEEEGDGRDDVPHPGVRAMHLLHPDAYAPDPHGRLPPAGSLPSPRNMTLLGMKAAVKVEEELHMAAMQQQQQQREEEEEGLDMSYKHGTGHYGRTVSGMTHHLQEEEEATQGVSGVGDPSTDDLQDFRVLRSPPVEGRFEQSQQGLDMSRGSFPFALPAARCFPLYESSTSAADVARSVDLRRAGLAYTSPPLPPYSQSLDLTPMRTRHSVDLSLPRTLVGTEGVGPQGGGNQSSPPPPSSMHRHLCHAPPTSPHHHVHHHHGVDPLGCVVGEDGGEGGSGGLSPPPAAYQPGAYLHAPPYHRQPPQHPPSPPPSPYHPQARTAPHMPPPPSASPSPYHHYSGYY